MCSMEHHINEAWWHTSAIPVLRMWQQISAQPGLHATQLLRQTNQQKALSFPDLLLGGPYAVSTFHSGAAPTVSPPPTLQVPTSPSQSHSKTVLEFRLLPEGKAISEV